MTRTLEVGWLIGSRIDGFISSSMRPWVPIFSSAFCFATQSRSFLFLPSGLFIIVLPTHNVASKGEKEWRGHVPTWGPFLRWGSCSQELPNRLLIFSEPELCSSIYPKPSPNKRDGMNSRDTSSGPGEGPSFSGMHTGSGGGKGQA